MSRNTGVISYDDCAAEGFQRVRDRGYPPISKETAAVLKIVAENLFITETSLQWAWFDASRGKSDSFKAIRDRLMSKPVTLTKGESDAKRNA